VAAEVRGQRDGGRRTLYSCWLGTPDSAKNGGTWPHRSLGNLNPRELVSQFASVRELTSTGARELDLSMPAHPNTYRYTKSGKLGKLLIITALGCIFHSIGK
jgi:hypothetical protein